MPKNNWLSVNWSDANCTCDILDKPASIRNYVSYMLDRTNQMFEYKGLPDTIPAYMLEMYLQINGQCCITEVDGNLYALVGGIGGAPDPYYRGTLYTVANPALGSKLKSHLKILNHLDPFSTQDYGGECVLIRNDTRMEGLSYLYSRYATQLTENDISIRSAQINSRMQALIKATTDAEAISAKKYIESLEAGKLVHVDGTPFIDDGLVASNISVQSANVIIQLIELQQYLKASWFNEIGLNSNFNMKREYLSEEELRESTDVLLPLIDDMLRCRKEALDVVNSTYGTSITVSKNSAWENKQKELDTSQKEAEMKARGGAPVD